MREGGGHELRYSQISRYICPVYGNDQIVSGCIHSKRLGYQKMSKSVVRPVTSTWNKSTGLEIPMRIRFKGPRQTWRNRHNALHTHLETPSPASTCLRLPWCYYLEPRNKDEATRRTQLLQLQWSERKSRLNHKDQAPRQKRLLRGSYGTNAQTQPIQFSVLRLLVVVLEVLVNVPSCWLIHFNFHSSLLDRCPSGPRAITYCRCQSRLNVKTKN